MVKFTAHCINKKAIVDKVQVTFLQGTGGIFEHRGCFLNVAVFLFFKFERRGPRRSKGPGKTLQGVGVGAGHGWKKWGSWEAPS